MLNNIAPITQALYPSESQKVAFLQLPAAHARALSNLTRAIRSQRFRLFEL